MNAHPSDPAVADLIHHARLGAATSQYPSRTRSVGPHSARQCSVGRLVVEAARADSGVPDDIAAARREVIATELERRRMVEAADQARRRAEFDLARAELERDDAVARARERGGSTPDFMTLALIAAVTFEVTDTDLIHIIDAAVIDQPELTDVDVAALSGERQVGLTPKELSADLAATGASPAVAHGLIDTGVGTLAPAELITQSAPPTTDSDPIEIGPQSAETSPEVG